MHQNEESKSQMHQLSNSMHQNEMQKSNPRRFLVINPNTNALTTRRLQEVLTNCLPENVNLEFTTAAFGAGYIACEASHAVASHACLEAWADHNKMANNLIDGVLIGCFGDPGLFALREIAAYPVTGLAEASFIQASKSGPFSIVTGGERWKPMLQRLAMSLGFSDQLRHIETVTPTGAELQANPQMAIECLKKACEQAAKTDVRSIILGGAGLAGYAQQIQKLMSLPVVDSATAGLELLINKQVPMSLRKEHGTYAQWTGMSDSMERLSR
jgi:Asp/Glu/hydantoin racemase